MLLKELAIKILFFGKRHSEETCKKLSETMKGRLPANTRKVLVCGVVYPSAAECGRVYNITTATVINRIKNPQIKEFNYADN